MNSKDVIELACQIITINAENMTDNQKKQLISVLKVSYQAHSPPSPFLYESHLEVPNLEEKPDTLLENGCTECGACVDYSELACTEDECNYYKRTSIPSLPREADETMARWTLDDANYRIAIVNSYGVLQVACVKGGHEDGHADTCKCPGCHHYNMLPDHCKRSRPAKETFFENYLAWRQSLPEGGTLITGPLFEYGEDQDEVETEVETVETVVETVETVETLDNWVQCDTCDTWRKVPSLENMTNEWHCSHIKKACRAPSEAENHWPATRAKYAVKFCDTGYGYYKRSEHKTYEGNRVPSHMECLKILAERQKITLEQLYKTRPENYFGKEYDNFSRFMHGNTRSAYNYFWR